MNLNKTQVLCASIGSMIGAMLIAAGPHPTNVAMELSIYMTKCAFALLILYTCIEKQK